MDITNEAQLHSILVPIVQEAVKYTMDMALKNFKKVIESEVYGAYTPVEYQRTYQFLDSWESEVNGNIIGAEGKIGQNLTTMIYNPTFYQHGSPITGDLRSELADILFLGTDSSIFGAGEWTRPRDAYFAFISDLTRNDRLVTWFRNSLKKHGISIRKI